MGAHELSQAVIGDMVAAGHVDQPQAADFMARLAHLGMVAMVAFAGAWRGDVEAFEMHADTERLPEVERLLTRCVRQAAQGAKADAIDSARSAAAACPEVPALAADVARIVAILEAT